uniref:Mucin-associated surface protein (MASP) n=1 Tax=Onchocerca flexuosa TaxID=387005 RepID=A0A183HRU3_9BILA
LTVKQFYFKVKPGSSKADELKAVDKNISRDEKDLSDVAKLNEKNDAKQSDAEQTQTDTVTTITTKTKYNGESEGEFTEESHIKIIHEEKSSISVVTESNADMEHNGEMNDSPVRDKPVTVVSGADGECSNEPETTSNAEAINTTTEEIGKIKSNEKLPKNESEEQKNISGVQEVESAMFP